MENNDLVRLAILRKALRNPEEYTAESLLALLNVNDPFREMHIKVWETDSPALVVWGTHDIGSVIHRSLRYYLNEIGLSFDEIANLNLMYNNLDEHGRRLWADPSLQFEEEWHSHMYGETQLYPTWIPYFVYEY